MGEQFDQVFNLSDNRSVFTKLLKHGQSKANTSSKVCFKTSGELASLSQQSNIRSLQTRQFNGKFFLTHSMQYIAKVSRLGEVLADSTNKNIASLNHTNRCDGPDRIFGKHFFFCRMDSSMFIMTYRENLTLLTVALVSTFE